MRRLSKKWRMGLIGGASLTLMVAVVPLAIWVTHTTSAQLGNEQARCQSVAQPVHKVLIQGGKAVPAHTMAKQCDNLTIINDDNRLRLMAFGPHEHHVSYDGVSEQVLGQGQSLTIKLIKTGTFYFHDHEDDSSQGSFTVTN